MTQLDVLFRYNEQPDERAVCALSTLTEVYGIRSVRVDEAARTVRVEFDATRLNKVMVGHLLRRAGMSVTEEVSLLPPQPQPALAEAVAKPA